MSDRFEEIRTFTAVARQASFTKAARSLGLALSAVSRRISELEERLGVRLLQRNTRRVSVTDAGSRLLLHGERLLDQLDAAEAEAADAGRGARIRIRVSAPMIFGARLLTPVVAEFCQAHPLAAVELSLDDQLVDVVGDRFDVALRIWRKPMASSLVARRLAPIRYVVCASPAYLLTVPPLRTFAALEGLRGLAYTRIQHAAYWRMRDAKTGVMHTPRIESVLDCDNGDALREAAIAGLGLTILPTFIVCEALREGSLRAVFFDVEEAPVHLYALYPSRAHMHPTGVAFVRFIAERFAHDSWTDGRGQPRRARRSP